MKLVIAEKPSVAQSLARVIGATKHQDGYLEGNGYLVSWCVGHLVELSAPERYDERFAKWRLEFNLDLYVQTFDTAIQFAKDFPETLWCYGNHDTCYPWNQREIGYSKIAPWTVCEKLRKLQEALPDEKQLTFLHRIDNVLFCHGGLTDKFVRQYVPAKCYNNVDAVIGTINGFGARELWQDASPLWYRPQYYGGKMYKPRKLLQVVGHTPVETIMKKGNLISCDVFSTYRDGKPIGTQKFLVLDTDNWDYKGIR